MQIPNFCIFALRITNNESIGKKLLDANQYYTFLNGFHIKDNSVEFHAKEAGIVTLYDDYLNHYRHLHVNISALVGSNGAGKSTLVEFVLRLINNFSVSLFGDLPLFPAAEHLTYIDGVFGELYYMSDGIPHLLQVSGENVKLYVYSRCKIDEKNSRVVFSAKTLLHDWDKSSSSHSDLTYKNEIVKHFFYTFVSNYSLYAYNPHDFNDEGDCWLNGLFHKNDGYQTPLVITPYRKNGNIDSNTERTLSKERLMALLFHGSGFITLNGHLDVVGFELTQNTKQYNLEALNADCSLHYLHRAYRKIQSMINGCWREEYNCVFDKSNGHPLQAKALEYLAYKTIKVAMKYRQYRKYYDALAGVRKWPKEKHISAVKEMVHAMSLDYSHITIKIRQTLCFLVRGCYQEGFLNLENAIKIKKIAMRSMKEDWEQQLPLLYSKTEDVLPSPIFNVSIILHEQHSKQNITLEKLSSGERQQIYTISSILYHLANINSVHSDANKQRVAYNRVNVILEEIELYFHPEMQRNFLLYLLDGLRQMYMDGIKAVSFLIVTHSPFVLSDIPATNIMTLKDGVQQHLDLQSFGANIHDMLNTNFFMKDGCKGLFSEWVVKRIVQVLNMYCEGNGSAEDCGESSWLQNYPKEKLLGLIMTIDEPIVQRVLLDKYDATFGTTILDKRIELLEAELKRLKDRRN